MNRVQSEDFSCQICFFKFGPQEKTPRNLTCGHTFCQKCLERLIKEKSKCPTCNGAISAKSIEEIPINFLVKSIAERFSENVQENPHTYGI